MKTFKKVFVGTILMMCLLTSFTACGAKEKGEKASDYTGYYTLRLKGHNIAMQISKKGDVTYMHERDGSHRGTMEMEDGTALIYLNAAYSKDGETNSSYSKFCPLKLKLTGGGKQGFLSSDHSSWAPDSFEVVDKKTFDEFIDVVSTDMVTWDGKEWHTLEDRNPTRAKELEDEKNAKEIERLEQEAQSFIQGMISELWLIIQYEAEENGGKPEDYAREIAEEYFGDEEDPSQVIVDHLDEILSNGCDDDGRYLGDISEMVREYVEIRISK